MAQNGNIVISHQSAAAYWNHFGSMQDCSILRSSKGNPHFKCAETSQSMRDFNRGHPGFGRDPVHLLIADKAFTRSQRDIVTHVCKSKLPVGSFFQIDDNVFVSSPSLCLAQLARSRTQVQLAELAMNFASDYYIDPFGGTIENRAKKISTLGGMRRYLEASRVRGHASANKALSWAVENARSPMEVKVSLLMRWPTRLGGHGMPFHVLNWQVDASSRSDIAEQGRFFIDIAMPDEKIGVEYYGEAFHIDAAKDRRRLNGLQALGWRMLTLDKWQLYNPDAFRLFINQLAEELKITPAYPRDWKERNRRLRLELGLL